MVGFLKPSRGNAWFLDDFEKSFKSAGNPPSTMCTRVKEKMAPVLAGCLARRLF